jgi:NAD(P)-dependent dehydrogenase (short-subunit alcohol dehydrogenase family)
MRRFTEVVRGGGEERPTNPLGIMGTGADIAHLVLYLCSPAAQFVSGQVIAVDGAGTTDQLKLNLGKV